MIYVLSRVPSTNLRVVAGISLMYWIVFGSMISSWFGRRLSIELVKVLIGGVVIVMGLDTAHFIGKRATHRPDVSSEAEES